MLLVGVVLAFLIPTAVPSLASEPPKEADQLWDSASHLLVGRASDVLSKGGEPASIGLTPGDLTGRFADLASADPVLFAELRATADQMAERWSEARVVSLGGLVSGTPDAKGDDFRLFVWIVFAPLTPEEESDYVRTQDQGEDLWQDPWAWAFPLLPRMVVPRSGVPTFRLAPSDAYTLPPGDRPMQAVQSFVGFTRADYPKQPAGTMLFDVAFSEPVEGGTTYTGYRPSGKLVPEITTHIPTPLDVSTDPKVAFANLLIAAVAMLLFTIALRVLNATLADHEGELQRAFPPARWLAGVQRRADQLVAARAGRSADILRLAGILLFYGVVFSFLQPGWNPLTITGLALLAYMTVAFGGVGIVDDIAQWRAAKRWDLPAELAMRPALALLAVSSTLATRMVGIVPGIMIGTPDAFPLEKEKLGESHQRRLLKIGALALLATGGGAWLLSIGTNLLLRGDLPGWLETAIGGLEAFLLIVFAVTVQNVFMQMLSFPGSIGAELERRSRWLWLGAFGATTFVFLHTLLNPGGDVAQALKEKNVQFFLGTVIAFVLVTGAIWLGFRRSERRGALKATLPPIAPEIARVPAPPPAPIVMAAGPSAASASPAPPPAPPAPPATPGPPPAPPPALPRNELPPPPPPAWPWPQEPARSSRRRTNAIVGLLLTLVVAAAAILGILVPRLQDAGEAVSAPGIGTVDPEMEAWMVKGGPAIREVFRASSDLGYLVKMDVLGLSDDCNRLERIARTLRATLPSPDAELNSEIRGMTEDLIAVNSEPPCHYAVQIEGGEITDTGSTSVKRFNKLWADADRHADRLRERLDALGY